ncbi:unnamed protein product [Trichogramma brassicae]|uniref:Reverse transcriptase/retrotransposon-derived protein RNase H-like domain-containing protein n=1 Tax=Trichogramma brassicae TaxID=86971 RepID=A0A6H5HUD4_9HYME|nr:unnamed protein product [Trichogramma brassicae]
MSNTSTKTIPGLKQDIITRMPTVLTLEDAYREAQKIEKTLIAEKELRSNTTKYCVFCNDASHETLNCEVFLAIKRKHAAPLETAEVHLPQYKKERCGHCGSTEHTVTNCVKFFAPNIKTERKEPEVITINKIEDLTLCGFCNRPNHAINNCLEYWNSVNPQQGHNARPRPQGEGVKCDPKKLDAIKKFPTPKTVKNVRQFLGLAEYYRRFIRNFAGIAKPLSELTKKSIDFEWTEECEKAINILKEKLCEQPILKIANPKLPYIVTCDASAFAIGGFLAQRKDKIDMPIGFVSRTLNETERKYDTYSREALAIVFTISKFKPYLMGNRFTVYTDHKPLLYFRNSTDPNSRVSRYQFKLSCYDFSIEYKEGSTNVVADCLSRNPIIENINTIETRPRRATANPTRYVAYLNKSLANRYLTMSVFVVCYVRKVSRWSPIWKLGAGCSEWRFQASAYGDQFRKYLIAGSTSECENDGRSKGKRYFELYHHRNSASPWYSNRGLTRVFIVTINRMRSNHHSLAESLYRKNIISDPECARGFPEESRNHILWSCEGYNQPRGI